MTILLPPRIESTEELRKAVAAQFEQETPPPVPPTPVTVSRPALIHVGDAHAWIEVSSRERYYGSDNKPSARMFVVGLKGDQPFRIEGELAETELDALIEGLQRAKEDLRHKSAYAEADTEYKALKAEWDSDLREVQREKEAEWYKTKKK